MLRLPRNLFSLCASSAARRLRSADSKSGLRPGKKKEEERPRGEEGEKEEEEEEDAAGEADVPAEDAPLMNAADVVSSSDVNGDAASSEEEEEEREVSLAEPKGREEEANARVRC